MELIEWILQDENMDKAIKSVKRNRGAYGVDKMSVEELDSYFAQHRDCLLYTSPSPRDETSSRMPSSA